MSPLNFRDVSFKKLNRKKCAEILIEYLKLEKVEYVFGIAGGTIVPILEALEEEENISLISTRHEGGAAFMADMYARLSGRLGVCLSTAGPGATNMLTGVACAHRDNVPLLAITGQPATHTLGKGAVQESSGFGVDTVQIYESIGCFSAVVQEPAVFRQMITTALRSALGQHKQAVHLSLPANVSSHVFDEYDMPTDVRKYRAENAAVDTKSINTTVDLLLKAKKPVLLLGSGGRYLENLNDLIRIAEMVRCPVVTSPQGKGLFPETHSLSLGVFGFAGQDTAKRILLEEKPDLILVIGSSLDEWTTNSWDSRLFPHKYLIQIDSDYQNIGRNFPVSLGVIGDLSKSIHDIHIRLKKNLMSMRGEDAEKWEKLWATRDSWIKKVLSSRKVDPNIYSPVLPLKPQRLMEELNKYLENDAVVIADAGNPYAWTLRYLKIDPPRKYLAGLGFASMGHASAGVIGAALAAPDRQVVAVVGDGSFLMNGMEIHTAVEYNIPAIWIILNDGALGMVHHGMKALTGQSISARFKPVNFAKLARVFGARGIRVTAAGELEKALIRIKEKPQPTVIDVLIDGEIEPPFLERIKGLKQYKDGE